MGFYRHHVLCPKNKNPEDGDFIKVCEWSEVEKLIKAFQDKYNDPGCFGIPYEPKIFKVQLFAVKQ